MQSTTSPVVSSMWKCLHKMWREQITDFLSQRGCLFTDIEHQPETFNTVRLKADNME